MSDELSVQAVQAHVEDDAIVVRIELHNDSDRALHAYRQSRRLLYDDATTIELRLPRVLTRIAGANDQGAPVLERFRIDEADEVEVEVGWGDTPFYRDPRPALARDAHPAAQLRNWESGLATARAPLAKGPAAG